MISSVNNPAASSWTQLYSAYGEYNDELKAAGENAVILDMDAGTAMVMQQNGQLRPATQAELEKALKDNDLKLDKTTNKFVDISDSYSLESADVNAAQSVGGAPILPAVGNGQDVGLNPASIEAINKAISRFGDQGLEANALLLQGLMAVLRSAQEDRSNNMELTINVSNIKSLITKVEINAKDLAIKSRIEQADVALNKAIVTGIINVACSCVGCAGQAAGGIANAAGQLVNLGLNVLVFRPEEKEAKEGTNQAEKMGQEARIDQEVLEQALESIKNASGDNREEFKQIMKLLQDVAQRQNDNVRVLSA